MPVGRNANAQVRRLAAISADINDISLSIADIEDDGKQALTFLAAGGHFRRAGINGSAHACSAVGRIGGIAIGVCDA
jgi:hypothetical protein